MAGAILAGASAKETALTEQIAADVGIAFQIQDDILDVVSTTEELGKPVHSDEKNAKTTYAALVGIARAKEEVRTRSERAVLRLGELKRRIAGRRSEEDDFLEELLIRLTDRKN